LDTINVLIYANPIVFLEQIEKHIGDLRNYCELLIRPLSKVKDREYKFTVIGNEFHSFKEIGFNKNVELINITQRELTNNWKYDPPILLDQWNSWCCNDETLSYYYNLFESKIQIKPDVIFVGYCTPFLRKLFSDTLIFSISVGIISRAPFPQTTSFVLPDYGMLLGSYSSKFRENVVLQTQQTINYKELINKFKVKVKEIIDKKNPYIERIREYRKIFKHIYIYPLSVPYNTFGAIEKNYHNDFHFLLDVLERVPKDVGIIVTVHPYYKNIDDDLIYRLRKKYRSFIYDDSFSDYLSSSQFIIPDVDGVICMHSSVAIQAMIFDKKIIATGETFLKGIRDSSSINEFVNDLDKPPTYKDDILFWNLTRYCMTADYYQDSEWLDRFITNSMKKFNDADIENFYDLIDDPETVINKLIKSLDDNVPQPSSEFRYGDRELLFNYRYNKPIKYDVEYSFNADSFNTLYLVRGFSHPEQTHIWSVEKDAEIEFPIATTEFNLKIIINGEKIVDSQSIGIEINGKSYGEIIGLKNEFIVTSVDLIEKKCLRIKLIASSLYTPIELGCGDDPRTLGFSLKSIGIYESKSEEFT